MFSDSEVVSSWLRSEVVSGRVFNFRNEMIETVMTRSAGKYVYDGSRRSIYRFKRRTDNLRRTER